MKGRRQKKRGKRVITALWVVLFLLWSGNGHMARYLSKYQGQFLSVGEAWDKGVFAGSSLSELMWEEQKQAMADRMYAENRQMSEEKGSSLEMAGTGSVQENDGDHSVTSAPEDMAEWERSMIERDGDLLAEIDRENEVMWQQAELLQQQQNQQTQHQEGQRQEGLQSLTLPYTQEQLGSLEFMKKHLYNVNGGTKVTAGLLDADTLLAMDMRLQQPDSKGPKVLIHHTHATEYFVDSNTKDENTLIVGVGEYLKEILETRYGIEVIHDQTVYPYNEAYSQALKNVENILAEHPTIEVFVDLHRDAGGTKKYTVNVDGKEMAHLMFFNGLSYSTNGPIDYLPNKNQQANLAFSFQLKLAGDSLYPGLCKRNYLKAYRYNLHVLPRAVIVEVGDNNNTFQEAKNAMEPLAEILHLILMGRK